MTKNIVNLPTYKEIVHWEKNCLKITRILIKIKVKYPKSGQFFSKVTIK